VLKYGLGPGMAVAISRSVAASSAAGRRGAAGGAGVRFEAASTRANDAGAVRRVALQVCAKRGGPTSRKLPAVL
jgi:hypothetical protein